MNCRIDITGHKIWNDDNNVHGTRPSSVEIRLFRDGEFYKSITLTSAGDWKYKFPCLIAWKNSGVKYVYTIDEDPINGYSKTIQEYNIINTLNEISISGTKIWDDNHNETKIRPATITVNLLQNGTQFRTLTLSNPPAEDRIPFNFENIPFADNEGKAFIYTVDESTAAGYKKSINGFNITNTLITGGFSFNKTSIATGLSLQGAVFELKQNGIVISSSASDAAGIVSFDGLLPGSYQMAETVPPVGYMNNTDIYDVDVSDDGIVTIDGISAIEFSVINTPEIIIRRATAVAPAYMVAPNTWPLHGTIASDLYMLDKILISLPCPAITVKWAYGIQDETYFRSGGGIDITTTYQSGFSTPLNTDYTVYIMFRNGTDVAKSITIDRIRDGSEEMPYLLIDFSTADALEPSVPGIDQFTLYYMQGNGIKLTQHYELYENVEMTGKDWAPLGDGTQFGFTGTFYGNDNDIKNMSIITSDGSVYNTGMFAGVSNGAVIEKAGLINCTIVNTRWDAAGFAGLVAATDGSATILKDLRFSGSVTSNATGAGMVSTISALNGNVLIDGCTADGIITGVSSGGIAGFSSIPSSGTVAIINCYTTGSCHSTGTSILNYAGGILGACSDTGNGLLRIQNCVNAMSVQSNAKAGGIVGTGTSAFASIISTCLNLGKITGVNQAGGIVGGFTGSSSTNMMRIENCYNTAGVTANVATAGYAGGIIGICYSYVNVRNSYSTGDVVSSTGGTQSIVGGVSGNYGIIENCASINSLCSSLQSTAARISQSTTSASLSVLNNNVAFDNMQVLLNGIQKFPLDTGNAGTDGISVSAATIKTQTLYETILGWDFTNVWSFGNGVYTLPILRGIPASLQPTILPPHLM